MRGIISPARINGSSYLGEVRSRCASLGCNSAFAEHILPFNAGLNGEIRNVTNLTQRMQEVDKLGFKRCVVPAMTEELNTSRLKRLSVLKCKKLSEALVHALS